MEIDSTQERRSGAGKIIVIVALIFLVVADIFLLYNLFDKDETIAKNEKSIKTLNVTKDSLESEIVTMQQEIDMLKKQLSDMGESTTAKEQELAKMTATLNRMKQALGSGGLDPNVQSSLKKQLAALKQEKDSKQAELDAKKREIELLSSRNQQLKDSLENGKKETDKAKKDKGIVDKRLKESQALKADNIVAIPLKVSSSGKEKPVTKASKVTKVQIAFKIQQNLASEAGAKTLYMRVLGPDRSVITSNANETFTFDGDNLPYTDKKEIQYDNKDTNVKFNFKKGSTAYTKGNYTVELYEGGMMIGKTNFSMK